MIRIVVVLGPCSDGDAIGILLQCHDFDAAQDLGALGRGIAGECVVDIGLWCDRDERELRTQVCQIDSCAGEDGDAGCAVRLGKDVVGQTAGVENLQCPGHRGERPARWVHARPAFEDDDRAAAPGEVACRGQSGGSGTDDEYVDAL